MNYIDTKYINLVSVRLNKFAEKKRGLYNFRCPYCGDSQKYKNKCRGYWFLKKNDIIYWKGHVAVALSNKKLIHAYGPMKKTVIMDINQTIKRIERTAKLKVIGIKRL